MFPKNVVLDDKVLSAINGLEFPLHFNLKKIYVRDCFDDLFQLAVTEWSCDQAVFISGTPGVGKSYFLNYVLLRLLGLGKIVLFLRMGTNDGRKYSNFDENPVIMKLDDEGLSPEIIDSVDYILIDPPQEAGKSQGLTLDHLRGKKFMVALSPDRENCKDLTKEANNDGWYYMGPTSWQESNHMRARLYNNVPESIMHDRYQLAGGIPRILFKSWHQGRGPDKTLKKIQEKQTAAIADVIEVPRRIDATSLAAQFQHLWSLYHLFPSSDHSSYTIEICGLEPYSLLRQRLLDFSVRQLWDLFKQTDEQMGSLRGIRYEAYVHKRILTRGLTEVARKFGALSLLSEGRPENILQLHIPPHVTRVVLKTNNVSHQLVQAVQAAITQQNGGYLLPRLPNFPIIDSAYVPPTQTLPARPVLFQMKSSGDTKALSADLALSIVRYLSSSTLVVVTPYEYVVKKRLAGPKGLEQYLLILNEDLTIGSTIDAMEEWKNYDDVGNMSRQVGRPTVSQ